MKIAFVGKGGSGKTTLASLVALRAFERGIATLAVDADINQHLGDNFGIESPIKPSLSEKSKLIKEYLFEHNPRVTADDVINSTPPGTGSHFIRLAEENPVSDACFEIIGTNTTKNSTSRASTSGSLKLARVGIFSEEDVSVKCYHGKILIFDVMLNHILDRKDELVVADMTAGADSFASGIFTKFDVVYIVMEPTKKSADVYRQYQEFAAPFGVRLAVIGNKVTGPDDENFIRSAVSDLPTDNSITAIIPLSADIRVAEKTASGFRLSDMDVKLVIALDAIIDHALSAPPDWKKRVETDREIHLKNCRSYANAAHGKDLAGQIDPSFSYDSHMQS